MIKENIYQRVCPSGSVPYVIRPGDTLGSIASLYNSTISSIMDANPGINPYNLIIGSTICVPLTKQLYPSCPTSNYYVVKSGDTFNSIAAFFNVTFEQLYYANYGIDVNNLYLDQVLCIPVNIPPTNLVIDTTNKILNVFAGDNILKTYGILSASPQIPKGTFIILNKEVDPGEELGARWLGLSLPGFGIHGTNTPEFIQNLAINSIILTNEDIAELFNMVTVGTNVTIS